MKKNLVVFGALASFGVLHGEEGFTNVIEMVELGAGDDAPILWNMPGEIAATGTDVLVGEPVPEAGALFILSTIQAEPFQDWFLAETAVGAFLPRAKIKIVTHDTESEIPRTRADQQFEVKVSVSGLFESGSLELPRESVQRAATEVTLQRFVQDYPEGQNVLPGGEVTNPVTEELSLVGNGEFPQTPGDLTFDTGLSLSAPDLARGEEHFVVRSENSGVGEGGAIAQKFVQVWPVWSGQQVGLESPDIVPYDASVPVPEVIAESDGELEPLQDLVLADGEIPFDSRPPEMTFTWNNLYPTSTVGVIVNDASVPYPWGGRWVSGSQRVFNENGSVDWTHTESDWTGIFDGSGRYAIWIVAFTPGIGWEVGGNYDSNGVLQPGGWIVPIQENRIRFRGSIQSLSE